MDETQPCCLVCQQTQAQIPLLALIFQDKTYWICPQHFPILIHQPDKLVGLLPGAEKLKPHAHES